MEFPIPLSPVLLTPEGWKDVITAAKSEKLTLTTDRKAAAKRLGKLADDKRPNIADALSILAELSAEEKPTTGAAELDAVVEATAIASGRATRWDVAQTLSAHANLAKSFGKRQDL